MFPFTVLETVVLVWLAIGSTTTRANNFPPVENPVPIPAQVVKTVLDVPPSKVFVPTSDGKTGIPSLQITSIDSRWISSQYGGQKQSPAPTSSKEIKDNGTPVATPRPDLFPPLDESRRPPRTTYVYPYGDVYLLGKNPSSQYTLRILPPSVRAAITANSNGKSQAPPGQNYKSVSVPGVSINQPAPYGFISVPTFVQSPYTSGKSQPPIVTGPAQRIPYISTVVKQPPAGKSVSTKSGAVINSWSVLPNGYVAQFSQPSTVTGKSVSQIVPAPPNSGKSYPPPPSSDSSQNVQVIYFDGSKIVPPPVPQKGTPTLLRVVQGPYKSSGVGVQQTVPGTILLQRNGAGSRSINNVPVPRSPKLDFQVFGKTTDLHAMPDSYPSVQAVYSQSAALDSQEPCIITVPIYNDGSFAAPVGRSVASIGKGQSVVQSQVNTPYSYFIWNPSATAGFYVDPRQSALNNPPVVQRSVFKSDVTSAPALSKSIISPVAYVRPPVSIMGPTIFDVPPFLPVSPKMPPEVSSPTDTALDEANSGNSEPSSKETSSQEAESKLVGRYDLLKDAILGQPSTYGQSSSQPLSSSNDKESSPYTLPSSIEANSRPQYGSTSIRRAIQDRYRNRDTRSSYGNPGYLDDSGTSSAFRDPAKLNDSGFVPYESADINSVRSQSDFRRKAISEESSSKSS